MTTPEYLTQAEELLSGSFHEMRRQVKVIDQKKLKELYSLEQKLNDLKDELDL